MCAHECRCAQRGGVGAGYAHVNAGVLGGQKRATIPLQGMVSQVVVSLLRVLGTELTSSQEQEALFTDKLSLQFPYQAFHGWETESKQNQTPFQLRNSAKTFPPSLLSPAGNAT